MTKVYMVTDGWYSDYSVLGIYSTKAKAERAKELYAAGNDVDEIRFLLAGLGLKVPINRHGKGCNRRAAVGAAQFRVTGHPAHHNNSVQHEIAPFL